MAGKRRSSIGVVVISVRASAGSRAVRPRGVKPVLPPSSPFRGPRPPRPAGVGVRRRGRYGTVTLLGAAAAEPPVGTWKVQVEGGAAGDLVITDVKPDGKLC